MASPSIGKLNEKGAVRRLVLDDVTFTYIVDAAMWMDPGLFTPAIPSTYWHTHPEALDSDGQLTMSAGGLLVERNGYRLLIDAGLGEQCRPIPFGRNSSGAFLEVLQYVGAAAPSNEAPGEPDAAALARLRYRANHAPADVDTLLSAADARSGAGTWEPGGAKSAADYGQLGDAADIVARQRTRQRW